MTKQTKDLPAQTEEYIQHLMSLKKITREDVDKLTTDEKKKLNDYLADQLHTLKDTDKDRFIEKISVIMTNDAKNDQWERNHAYISHTIAHFIQEKGRMPTKVEIALETGLSRPTVYAHFNQFKDHPSFKEHLEQINFMNTKLMATVLQQALDGDIKAARLYFDMTGKLKEQDNTSTVINNQNNYIQINGHVLSQQTIQQLKPQQLKQIEEILSIALPENKTP